MIFQSKFGSLSIVPAPGEEGGRFPLQKMGMIVGLVRGVKQDFALISGFRLEFRRSLESTIPGKAEVSLKGQINHDPRRIGLPREFISKFPMSIPGPTFL